MSIYFLLLLVMVLLLYVGMVSSLGYAPKKIKIISTIALILMTLRYISLIILFLIKNQSYLYLLKPLVFTNLLCIPICGIISIYIFSRNNKIKLKLILFICVALCSSYLLVINKSAANINISSITGYTIEFELKTYCYMVLLVLNSVFLIKGINLFNKIYSNKLGAVLIIIASTVTLVAITVSSISPNFPMILLGDIAWIIALDYGLIKFKR